MSKRGAGAVDDTPITRSAMDDILATLTANCAEVAKEQIEATHSKYMSETHAALKQYDTALQKQLGGMETELSTHNHRLKQLEDDNASFKGKISELERLAAIAETTPVNAIIEQDLWEAQPDPTKLRIGSPHDPVSWEALDKLVASLVEKCNVSHEHYKLVGSPLGSNFTLQFTGRPDAAARRAKQFFGVLRNDDGQFEEIFVDTPAGTPTRIYFDPDKCPRQRSQETIGRSLKKTMQTLLPSKTLAVHKWNKRKETKVCVDLKPIVIIECKTKDSDPVFWWDELNLEAVGTTKRAILDKYEASQQSFRDARAARWSK